jgi:hypothetical protein
MLTLCNSHTASLLHLHELQTRPPCRPYHHSYPTILPSVFRDPYSLTDDEDGPASDPFDALDLSGRSTRLRTSLTARLPTDRRNLASAVSVAPHALAQDRGPVPVRGALERSLEERGLADVLEQQVRSRRGGLVGRRLVR